MAEMTKGARRRNAYVNVAVEATLLSGAVISVWPWWAIVIISAFLIGNLHELATIGFTSRADSEQ